MVALVPDGMERLLGFAKASILAFQRARRLCTFDRGRNLLGVG
jgi:hypothetical protein